jgi:hypothetical protein
MPKPLRLAGGDLRSNHSCRRKWKPSTWFSTTQGFECFLATLTKTLKLRSTGSNLNGRA